ncbi:adenylate/guanylate cyclase domain-containing protein [Rhodoferax sp.]|uniref:adenylate/guanylate cyclase domain-containing protein n=1 Tax=Rhodoferax sp. TaxID=50421 RepID=UPI001ECFBFAE|nr:adenylate/guanylate cyclase domain-containing protein [Rhodoferax sp.]MBT9507675.1 adenylate/guanylate cyclase domain-containing protein [Rhodoferax sp.]
MKLIDDAAAAYMVLHDLRTTHTRRVRVMVIASSALLILIGLGYGVFFAFQSEWLIAAAEGILMLAGIVATLLVSRQHLRAASIWLASILFVVIVSMASFMDLPSADIPRSAHHFLIPLAVATYLMLKNENNWLKHGFPVACLIVTVFFAGTDFGMSTRYAVPDSVRAGGTWVNNFAAMGILYLLVHIFVGDINRMESYLHSANNRFVTMVSGMFPKVIAERLLASGETFAERHANCSVLFADIVGFTGITERMSAEALVKMLSEIFSRFDRCVEQSGLTKIKTIGDAYMVAAGVPESNPDHARVLVALAQEMLAVAHDFEGIDLRIGIASGELVAGVIGQSRQVFDVWGDVVNVASRMESHGLPGRIQLSESSHALTKDHFDFELRSGITIKGKNGTHNVYLLCPA